jgi:CubicO group peptidase (beta-lactamase class C family)
MRWLTDTKTHEQSKIKTGNRHWVFQLVGGSSLTAFGAVKSYGITALNPKDLYDTNPTELINNEHKRQFQKTAIMKNVIGFIASVLLFVNLIVSVNLQAQEKSKIPGLDDYISTLFKKLQNDTMPGASVLVAQNGDIVYQKGFGYADIEKKIQVAPDTKFKIGSISKQFTAVAVLKLQEEGKITTEDKLSKYIPDFPRGNEVTIYQLLTHTSGIHDYNTTPGLDVSKPVTPQALLDIIEKFPYDSNPGERYLYNNSGYFILGYIVAQLSGKTLSEYLNETFFKPLGMGNTGIYETNIVLNNEAQGYSMNGEKVKKADFQEMSWALGVGSIYSTTKDLYKWNEAIFNGKVLSNATLKTAFTQSVLKSGAKVDYGFGWFLITKRGFKFIQHSGGSSGFSAYLERQPETNLTVCVLLNSLPSPEGIQPILNGQAISEFILRDKMENQNIGGDMTVNENILKKYVGRYNYGQGMAMWVTMKDKQLFGQMTMMEASPLTPISENEFYFKASNAKIKFVTDTSSKVDRLFQYQNGEFYEATRLKDETPVKINPDFFDKLTGKYDFGNNYVIEILKENDRLFVLTPYMPKYELLPTSELDYFAMEVASKITFILNKEGKAESLSSTFDGMNLPAKRLGD